MNPFRVIIAGGRDFDDYALLCSWCDYMLQKIDPSELIIVSGTAKGADRLGERYAEERGIRVERYPADWYKHRRGAGYIRNAEMANVAQACILFWNGNSRGTMHMRDLADKKGLKLKVVSY